MTTAPFPVTPELTAIAIGYKNARYIADDVLPRVPVSKQEFKYRKYALGDSFQIPNTKVGRTSRPSEIEFGFTEQTGATEDFGLDDPIPQADIMNAPAGYDPRARATEQLSNAIMLDREARAAALVFDAAQYGSSNKVTLTGNDQWSAFTTAASDPVEDIATALDTCIMRPNIMVLGQQVWNALSRHPKIIASVYKNSGTTGIARRQDVADLFELEAIMVGAAWAANTKKGQTTGLARLWGKFAALIYRDRLADARSGVTFGFTAEFGTRVAGSINDPDIGLRGGERLRVGESVKEVITANDLGYLFSGAVA